MSVTKSIKETYEGLPPVVQMVLIVAILAFVYSVLSRIFKAGKTRQQGLNAKADAIAHQQNGEDYSYALPEYSSMANRLYNAMDGAGTDDAAVEDVFNSLNNNLDFLALRGAFGMRDGYTWQEWIDGDLGDSQKQDINNSLQAKSIIYRI